MPFRAIFELVFLECLRFQIDSHCRQAGQAGQAGRAARSSGLKTSSQQYFGFMFDSDGMNGNGHIKLRSSQAVFCKIVFCPLKFCYIVRNMQNHNNIAKNQAHRDRFYVAILFATCSGEHKLPFVILLQLARRIHPALRTAHPPDTPCIANSSPAGGRNRKENLQYFYEKFVFPPAIWYNNLRMRHNPYNIQKKVRN